MILDVATKADAVDIAEFTRGSLGRAMLQVPLRLMRWHIAYRSAVRGTRPEPREAIAAEDIDRHLGQDRHRILLGDIMCRAFPFTANGRAARVPHTADFLRADPTSMMLFRDRARIAA